MMHELKNIFKDYLNYKEQGLNTILATVVHLDGSSYRRPGVRMLIAENGKMTGAVSGGCVEKEVLFQASSVFKTGKPKMMTYDGRFRLGCEGILYILIEPFSPSNTLLEAFKNIIKDRNSFSIISNYEKDYGEHPNLGSYFEFYGNKIPLQKEFESYTSSLTFKQILEPCYKLFIVGAEHDTVKLSQLALNMGWEVMVSTVPAEGKNIADFPGIDTLYDVEPLELPVDQIDHQTAVVLMTHSYVKDLKYLFALQEAKPMYFGLLGPSKRREKLFNEFIELYPDSNYDFFEMIHGPAGLNIGAESPEEIAIAILAEILTVLRGQKPIMLKDKKEGIHN
ncbi:XdhC family protein [Maribacter sp. CXY002]|uniref:XdhC family protein n=1 Tax=Maribacter luteocoastalis TaxID=3407671 RepID=UPI003B67B44A